MGKEIKKLSGTFNLNRKNGEFQATNNRNQLGRVYY